MKAMRVLMWVSGIAAGLMVIAAAGGTGFFCPGCAVEAGFISSPSGDPEDVFSALVAVKGSQFGDFTSIQGGNGPILATTDKIFAGGWLQEGHFMLAEMDSHPVSLKPGESSIYFYDGGLWWAHQGPGGLQVFPLARLQARRER